MKYPTHSLHQAVREKVQERLIVISSEVSAPIATRLTHCIGQASRPHAASRVFWNRTHGFA